MQLFLGDCLEKLRELPDASVDCVITDPPYGIGETAEKNNSRGGACEPHNYSSYSWDKKKVEKEYFKEIFRVSKKQVIFGGNYYTDILAQSDGWVVWDKRCSDKMKNDLSDGELVWTSEKRGLRIIRYLWNGMIQANMRHKEERWHPTQKPVKVMEELIKMFTKEGNIVLDPFMGSGTTGVAALKLGRDFIGMEISEEYFKIAEKRINDVKAQTRLFQ